MIQRPHRQVVPAKLLPSSVCWFCAILLRLLIVFLEGTELRPTLFNLLSLLDPNIPVVDTGLSAMSPMLFLSFDEAHSLAYPRNIQGQLPQPTAFSEMRRAIRQMNDFPIFAYFLSTTGNIHDFTPPPDGDPSKRANERKLTLNAPFTELGFDQMLRADNLKVSNDRFDVDYVSRIGFMSRLGRPL